MFLSLRIKCLALFLLYFKFCFIYLRDSNTLFMFSDSKILVHGIEYRQNIKSVYVFCRRTKYVNMSKTTLLMVNHEEDYTFDGKSWWKFTLLMVNHDEDYTFNGKSWWKQHLWTSQLISGLEEIYLDQQHELNLW